MYFDTHTHVNFRAFKDDAEDTISRALKNETWMVNVGTQIDASRMAVELADKFENGVYAAIGLHPVHTFEQELDEEESHFKTREEVFDEQKYESLINNKVVAVGECGLDYFRLPLGQDPEAIKKVQQKVFTEQLIFAQKNKLPVIIHCRDAYEDLLEIMKAEYKGQAVIHSFTDTWETAKRFLDLGYYIALNGILTFDKTGKLAEVCKNTPNDRILVETDAPYLTPPPFRGKRNEPAYVQYVAAKVAEIKGLTLAEAGEMTFKNACSLFGIKNQAS
jgi:TatD DNase family protein